MNYWAFAWLWLVGVLSAAGAESEQFRSFSAAISKETSLSNHFIITTKTLKQAFWGRKTFSEAFYAIL
jgi:hypothetical protein